MLKPNKLTVFAANHPVAYSAFTVGWFALLVIGSLHTFGYEVVLIVTIVGGVLLFALNLYLWHGSGPGRRWYQRKTAEYPASSAE